MKHGFCQLWEAWLTNQILKLFPGLQQFLMHHLSILGKNYWAWGLALISTNQGAEQGMGRNDWKNNMLKETH